MCVRIFVQTVEVVLCLVTAVLQLLSTQQQCYLSLVSIGERGAGAALE